MFFTERLMLRAIDPEADLHAIVHWFNDEDFSWAMMNEAPRPFPKDKVKKFIDSVVAREDGLPLFIVSERPNQLPSDLEAGKDRFLEDGTSRHPAIGNINFSHRPAFSFVNRITSFGIGLDKAHQGMGYGSELLEWAQRYAFETLGLHKMELLADADNTRAIKLYEKFGFVHEGRLRSQTLKNGVWTDTVAMGILETEWQERQDQKRK